MKAEKRVCDRCIMDTTDPDITFDSDGVCNHCTMYDRVSKERYFPDERGREILDGIIRKMKADGADREYDCILGVSGGVDSTYCAYLTKKLGLRPLAVHFDCGWDSELAVKNIENLLRKLDIDLFTYVVDWEEMRDLQLAFLRSGVANCDVPTDHAIVASLFRVAAQHGIRYIISGANIATESVLPEEWGYSSSDLRHVNAIQRAHGTMKLKKYPQLPFFHRFVWYRYIKRIALVRILDYVPYVKKDAMRILRDEFGWRYYGGKHYESQFTKFFQGYYLPKRFGFDKRRAHLSSLICSGQLTRAEALEEIAKDALSPSEATESCEYVAKKLGITPAELDQIIAAPLRTYRDYASNERLFRLANRLRRVIERQPGRTSEAPARAVASVLEDHAPLPENPSCELVGAVVAPVATNDVTPGPSSVGPAPTGAAPRE